MTLNNREKTPDRLTSRGLKEQHKFVRHRANDSERSIDMLKSRELNKSKDKSRTINVNTERLSNDFTKNKSRDKINSDTTRQSKSPLSTTNKKKNNIRAVYSKIEKLPVSKDWNEVNSPKFSNKLLNGIAKRTSIDYLNIDGDPKIEDITMSRIDNNQTIDNIEKERKLEKISIMPSEEEKKIMRLELIKQHSIGFLNKSDLLVMSLTCKSLFKECLNLINNQLLKRKSENEKKLKKLKEVK